MIPLIADENLNRSIVLGIRRVYPTVDIVLAQEVGLVGASDPIVLEWAAKHGRILVSHDFATIPSAAWHRVREGHEMPGVMMINGDLPVGEAVEALELVLMSDDVSEWQDTVTYLPL